jgi:putative Mg2+ transporter-C (MgtC) family protein
MRFATFTHGVLRPFALLFPMNEPQIGGMEWILKDWRSLIPGPWGYVILALIAVVCGSIVGLEREQKEKPAGMLTLALVCLGAAIFTMVSYVFDEGQGDPSRVAAQVVTGIGFLGAGVILRGGGGISGTVTAATIWAMAAIGMVIGIGYAGSALALSIFVLGVLVVVSWIQRRLIDLCGKNTLRLVFDPAGGKTLLKIEQALDWHEVGIHAKDLRPLADGLMEARLTYSHPHSHHPEFLGRLADFPEIKEIYKENLSPCKI